MTVRFLRPTSDLVFKKIFGENPDLVKSFLNSILPLPEDGLIEHIEYLQNEQVPRIPGLKNTIVDVKCTDQQGRIFIVEMQMTWHASFMKRFLFNTGKAYVHQLDEAQNYDTLCPVYGLAILNDRVGLDKSDKWYYCYRLSEVNNSLDVIEGIELVLVELPKFRPRDWMDRRMGVLWLRFLREMKEDLKEIPKEFLEDTCISKAVRLTQTASYTKKQLDAYDGFLDAVRVQNTIVIDALKQGMDKGLKEGKEEGMKEGLEKGKEEGIKEGKAEGIKAEMDLFII